MQTRLFRTPVAPDPGKGVLLGEHFQCAYLTNDIDEARNRFATELGINRFQRLEGPIKSGGYIKVELAWVGSLMYELMQTTDSVESVYSGQPPKEAAFQLTLHHLGYSVHDRQQWDALISRCERAGYAIPYRNRTDNFLEVCFIDVPWVPHYLEYFLLEPAGKAFLDGVPRHAEVLPS